MLCDLVLGASCCLELFDASSNTVCSEPDLRKDTTADILDISRPSRLDPQKIVYRTQNFVNVCSPRKKNDNHQDIPCLYSSRQQNSADKSGCLDALCGRPPRPVGDYLRAHPAHLT